MSYPEAKFQPWYNCVLICYDQEHVPYSVSNVFLLAVVWLSFFFSFHGKTCTCKQGFASETFEILAFSGHRKVKLWREKDPSTRKIIEGGSSWCLMFSLFSLHAKGCTCPYC